MSLVLIDTSAWIDFFRGERAAITRIDRLLRDGDAAVCGPIFAEVVSGAPIPAETQRLKVLLRGLEWLETPQDAWERIADARFALARAGTQAGLIDLLVALTAADAGASLLTRDRDFVRVAERLPLQVSVF